MCWTHPLVNLDGTLNWRSFIKIWTGQLKMVDGIFFGPCKNFIFSQFTKMNFIEKRMKTAVFQVLYHQAGIHKLSFIRPPWPLSPWISDTGELLTLLARTGQYFKIEYDLASYYESFGKERDALTRFPMALETVNPWCRTISTRPQI